MTEPINYRGTFPNLWAVAEYMLQRNPPGPEVQGFRQTTAEMMLLETDMDMPGPGEMKAAEAEIAVLCEGIPDAKRIIGTGIILTINGDGSCVYFIDGMPDIFVQVSNNTQMVLDYMIEKI